MAISFTFNVVDVFDYFPPNEPIYPEHNSRSRSFEVGGTDVEKIAHAFVEQRDDYKLAHKLGKQNPKKSFWRRLWNCMKFSELIGIDVIIKAHRLWP